MTRTEELVSEAIEQLVTTLVRQPRLPGDEDTGDLTTFQAIALATLVDDGALRLGALATRLGTTDATASRNVDVLERLGLVARVRDDADGRGIVVSPTVLGTQTVIARRARLRRLVRQLGERLGSRDGARFAELLGELGELLRK